MPGIEVELVALLVLQTLGTTIFARFEVETPVWRRLTKWFLLIGGTLALYAAVGHWSLLWPAAILAAGVTVHLTYCRRHGIDPLTASPRRKYYELRGWTWPD